MFVFRGVVARRVPACEEPRGRRPSKERPVIAWPTGAHELLDVEQGTHAPNFRRTRLADRTTSPVSIIRASFLLNSRQVAQRPARNSLALATVRFGFRAQYVPPTTDDNHWPQYVLAQQLPQDVGAGDVKQARKLGD